jgi:hypothetical protein
MLFRHATKPTTSTTPKMMQDTKNSRVRRPSFKADRLANAPTKTPATKAFHSFHRLGAAGT